LGSSTVAGHEGTFRDQVDFESRKHFANCSATVSKDGLIINDTHFHILNQPEKRLTAEAISAVRIVLRCHPVLENADTRERW
jgi:hypothetical protein